MANCVQCGRQLPGLTFGKKLCQWCVQHEAAKRGEDSPIQRVEAAPWKRSQSSSMIVTQAIVSVNVLVFVAMTLSVGLTVLGSPEWRVLCLRLGSNFAPYTIGGQWWRLLTSVFLHGGLLHIAFNMWCLWNLGRLAESIYGHWTYAAVYLITGVGASLASAGWHSTASNLATSGGSVGASGAIFGIAGALIASFYLGEFSLPRAVVSGMLRSVATFVGYNLFFGAVVSVTDNAAHIGGLLMGLVLGALIAKAAPDPTDYGRRIGVLLVGIVLAFAGAIWLSHSRGYVIHAANGERLLSDKHTDQAILELNSAIKERPDFLPARYELAHAYFTKGDFASAAAELKKLLQIDPTAQDAHYSLGMAYLQQAQTQLAQQSFSDLIHLNPTIPGGHFGLAEALAGQQKPAEALAEYQQTSKLDPDYDGVFQETGRVQLQLKMYDDAIASFLQQQKKGDSPENESLLAMAYQAKGMQPEAALARQKAQQAREQK